MNEAQLLVTFGVRLGLAAEPTCTLRIRASNGDSADRVERLLTGAGRAGLEVRSRPVPSGVSFQLSGTAGALRGLFGRAPDEGASSSISFRAELESAVDGALESWRRREFRLSLPRGRTWPLGEELRILGILNVTPDSFSDGGRFAAPEMAIQHAVRMVEDGADAIDIGGESTRPGAQSVPVAVEIGRVAAVVAEVRKRVDCPISIDTSKAEVARVALEEGADIINDVTGLRGDPAMVDLLVARPDVPVVIMHMRGTPRDMQDDPRYDDVVAEVAGFLAERLESLERRGLDPERTIVDPGIGFGKRSQDNMQLLRDVNEFRSLGRPVLVGLSRKSFLGKLLGASVEEREAGTQVANSICALAGAAVLRTHHVPNAREMKQLIAALDVGFRG